MTDQAVRQYLVDAMVEYDDRLTKYRDTDEHELLMDRLSDLTSEATDKELRLWADVVGFDIEAAADKVKAAIDKELTAHERRNKTNA